MYQVAFENGPASVVSSLMIVSRVSLVIFEAIKNQKLPALLEFIALAFGVGGAVILILPKKCFEKETYNDI